MLKISIIIPVYNVEKTLSKCINSVLAQSFSDYEIILVDDGSPDGCPDICDHYRDHHENITVIHQKNSGLSAARNAGLDAARGSYVMFLDSDDYLSENCLDVLYHPDADMIIGSFVRVFNNGNLRYQKARKDLYISYEHFAGTMPALLREKRLNYVHAKLFRRSVIEENGLRFEDDSMTSAEDTVFNFAFLQYCRGIYVSGRPVHFYVQNPDGLAVRFYPDRHDRYKTLDRYLRKICHEMDIDSQNMIKELNIRRVHSSIWTVSGILAQSRQRVSFRVCTRCLYRIRADRELWEILGTVSVKGSEQLWKLYRMRPVRFLLYYRYKNFNHTVKARLSRLCPSFIKSIRHRKLK